MRVLSRTLHLMLLGLALVVGCVPQNKEQGNFSLLEFSPTSGPRAGGIQITLTGADLQFTNQVTIGGRICTDLVVASPTSLTCILPAAPAGSATVVVRNIANNFRTATQTFTYNDGATVLSVSPSFGSTTGGTPITITGTLLSAGSIVRIGGALCSSPVYDPSETQITCTTSPRSAGTDLDVTVLNLEGDTTTFEDAYNYVAGPTIVTVSPNQGRTEGFPTNPVITITGYAFEVGAVVTIDGNNCPTTSVTSTSIVCQPPAGTAGGKEVRVTNPDALFGQRFNGYTYVQAPTLASVSPINGPLTGGQLVTVTGTNFFTGMTVDLGGSACTSVSVSNSTSLTCVTGVRGSQGSVLGTVTNSFGQNATLAGAYNYRSPPAFTSVTPSSVGIAGESITITGTDMFALAGPVENPRVFVNGQVCPVTSFTAPSSITCTAPVISPAPTTPQAVNIQIINPDNQFDLETGALTYIPAPTITSILPGSGPLAAINTVVITGYGFTASTTIDFLTAPFPTATCDYTNIPTELTCDIPSQGLGALTAVNVRASNPTPAQTTTLTNGYTFRPAPALTSTLPVSGSQSGGYDILINGTDFVAGAQLEARIDGVACTSTAYISATQIRCVNVLAYAGGLPGVVPVSVTNGDGQVSTGAVNFTYRLRPTITGVTNAQGPAIEDPIGPPVIARQVFSISVTDFDPTGTVTIGGVACPVVSNDGTTVVCTVPDLPAPLVAPVNSQIVLRNDDGQVSTDTFNYNYVGLPSVTGVSPSTGSASDASGTTLITLTGTNLSGPITSITLAGVTCLTPTVVSATQVTCILPNNAGSDVSGSVVYSQGDGLAATNTTPGFAFKNAPVIDDPATYSVSSTAAASFTLNGTSFYADSVVTFEQGATILSCPVTSANMTSLTCNKPAFPAGGVFDVRVVNLASPVLQDVLWASVTFIPDPTITSFSPFDRGRPGDVITVTGTNFNGGSMTVGGVACDTFSVDSATSITCQLPAGTDGLKSIVYTNAAGRTASMDFTYLPIPTISSITPAIGSSAGGTPVVIAGTGFVGTGWTVSIGSNCTPVVVVSATEIRCTTTARAAGVEDVVVSLASTTVNSTGGTGLFRYLAPPTPNLVTPASLLQTTAPTLVTITTANRFEGAVSVSLGGVACTGATITDGPTNQTIQCTAQAHPSGGPVDVVVTNGDGQTATVSGLFTYTRAPTITSVSPAAGSITGGTVLSVVGTELAAGVRVYLGSVLPANECTPATLNVGTQTITCPTPNFGDDPTLRVTRDVIVVNTDTQSATRTNAFTYQSAPLITSITPVNFGPIAGMNTLTINGDYFFLGVQVTVNGVTCGVQTRTQTQITCMLPPAPGGVAGGPYVLRVFNNDNQEATSTYSYVAAPTISSFNTTLFKTAGLETLVITGSGFQTGATVTVGGLPCTALSVDSSSQITCTNPNVLTPGQKTVVLSNLDGQSATVTNGLLFLAPPNLTAISPNAGSTAGGQTITLGGSGFYPGMTVSIGGIACTSVNVATDSVATCVTPASAAGLVNVQITVLGDSFTLNNSYTYRARPTIVSVTPNNGTTAGGTAVVITGTNFVSGSTPRFQGTNCTSVVFVNSTTLNCNTPARSAGVANIVINNPDGQLSTETVQYTYNAPPTITSISPTSGAVAGGTVITITGTNFVSGFSATVGGVACASTTFLSATSVRCTTANLTTAGLKSLVVTNPDTQAATLTNGFQAVAAPTISSVTPDSSLITGGISVTFAGTNFQSGAVARINGVNCTSTTFVSSTSLTCLVPAGAAATNLTISVVNPDTQNISLTNAFDYLDEARLEWQVGSGSPTPPNPDDFGITVTNVSHTYTLRNVGTTVSGTIVTSIEGAQASAFTKFPTDSCNGITLASGASCTMDVTFLGGLMSTGSYSATLRATAPSSGTADNTIQGTRP